MSYMGYTTTMTTTLIVVSDLHINSTIGLLAPNIKLSDGQRVTHAQHQAWQWSCFQDFLSTRKHGRVVTVINGEIADILHHKTTQLVTNDLPSIIDMALATLEPLTSLSEKIIVTKGTEAHSGLGSHLDELIAREIGADTLGTSDRAHWWAEFMIEGVKFDAAHHPRFGGGSYHTSHNAASRLAVDALTYAVKFDRPCPDVILRSHNHTFSDSGLNYPTRAFVTPAWQLSTHYSHRLGFGGKPMPIGGLIFYVSGSQYHVVPRTYLPEPSEAKSL